MTRRASGVHRKRGGGQGVRAAKRPGKGRKGVERIAGRLLCEQIADCSVCVCVWYVCILISVASPHFRLSLQLLFPQLHSNPSIFPPTLRSTGPIAGVDQSGSGTRKREKGRSTWVSETMTRASSLVTHGRDETYSKHEATHTDVKGYTHHTPSNNTTTAARGQVREESGRGWK